MAALHAAHHRLGHLFVGEGELRQQDHVRAAGHARIQGEPTGLVAHDLHHHGAGMAGRGGVQAVDDLGADVHGGVEAEGDVGAVQVVVDGLG